MQTCARKFSGNSVRQRLPLSLIASGLIILIAAAALFYLQFLAALYEKASRTSAAKSVVDQGAYISQLLREHPYFCGIQAAKEDREDFDRTVGWLQKMENAVQYVSVSEDGVILFQKQIAGPAAGYGEEREPQRGRTVVGRKKLVLGDEVVPVITFSMAQTIPTGQKRVLEIGLNKAIVERRNAAAASALRGMFCFSLAAVAVAFAVCLGAIVGLVHREMLWQKRIRLDEHLSFAGAVAGSLMHDFRNPLSAMRLDAQLLQGEAAKGNECRPERLAELSGRIVKTIDRLDGLLAEFLVMSRPESGERETFEINACVLDCIEMLKMRFQKAGLVFQADLAPGRLIIRGFPAQFKRALLNIMTNAEQLSPPAGKVTIQTRIEKKYALVKIMDEGPGIPYPERKKIFELFYSNRPGGTGIGLALARTAIENCGGEIECQTPPAGKGALFAIRIPAAEIARRVPV